METILSKTHFGEKKWFFTKRLISVRFKKLILNKNTQYFGNENVLAMTFTNEKGQTKKIDMVATSDSC